MTDIVGCLTGRHFLLANNRTQILFILILCVPVEPGSYMVHLFALKHVVVSLSLLSDALKHRCVIGFRPIKTGKSTGKILRRVYSLIREGGSLSVSSVCRCLELSQASRDHQKNKPAVRRPEWTYGQEKDECLMMS